MRGPHFSVILLATNQCDAACDYCFEQHTAHRLTLERLSVLTDRLLAYMVAQDIETAQLYWQGGEVFTLGPEWFERAHEMMDTAADRRGRRLEHYLQTNLIGYSVRWNGIIASMFNNEVSTSMDFPNVHRRLGNGRPEQYTRLWEDNLRAARAAGIRIGVIAVLTPASLAAGADAVYRYFADHLAIRDFQVNTPFAGGPAQVLWRQAPLPVDELCTFMTDLFAIWTERGYSSGVRLGPFDALVERFCRRPAQLPCIWQANCAEQFIAIDARGNMAQCDCWVTSYPAYAFGDAFSDAGIVRQLRSSPARAEFLRRPEYLVRDDDCASCHYLAICHGGCPVRAYAAHGTLFAKDPYCRMYQVIFERSERFARDQLLRQVTEAHRGPCGRRAGHAPQDPRR